MQELSKAVLQDEIGRSMVIRFNRPHVRSPLSVEVVTRLSEIVAHARNRKDLERVIFTGIGDIFASGADLREIANLGSDDAGEFALRGQRLMEQIAGLECRTVAAINGICFGGALDLALSCDLRIASPTAVFAHPGADLGIMTGWGGTQRLPRLIGEGMALDMFFTAKRVTATEALRIGLIEELATDPLEHALNSPFQRVEPLTG